MFFTKPLYNCSKLWYTIRHDRYSEVRKMQTIPQISVGDILEMKKPHPCSKKSVYFRVLRVGSDIRIVCESCGRDLTMPRIKLEKGIRRIIHESDKNC